MNADISADLKCLLCGANRIRIVRSLLGDEILKCWALSRQHFSPASVRDLVAAGTVHLYGCRDCGFQFFNPGLAGGAEFYEQLHQQGGAHYYAPDRPENERNVRFALEHNYRNILDVGCGTGSALDAAKSAGLETFGIELSRTAAAVAAQRGHKIFSVLLADMEPAWEGKFDLISLNQVLEHVPDPVGMVRQCLRFLSPRGAIAIAVPGAEGILRFSPWHETNWPPHHISRWRISDFYTLAERTNLKINKTGGDQLLGSALQMNLLGHRQRCQAVQKPYRGLPPAALKTVCFLYRKAGLKYLFNSQGHSIFCFLERKPPAQ